MSTNRDERWNRFAKGWLAAWVVALLALAPQLARAVDPFMPEFEELAPGVWAGVRADRSALPRHGYAGVSWSATKESSYSTVAACPSCPSACSPRFKK